jgi:nitroreductase
MMLDAINAIMTRRSVRAFKTDPIDEATIKQLVSAGMAAPSARNRRPYHFVTITEAATRQALKDKSMFGKMLVQAPLAIAVCGDKMAQPVHDFLLEDCSAATENILLAAHALGLGAVWIGVFALTGWAKFISKTLDLPAHVVPVSLIAIGIPDEIKKNRDRYEDGKWHRGKW